MFAVALPLCALVVVGVVDDDVPTAPPSASDIGRAVPLGVLLRAQPGAPFVSMSSNGDDIYVVDARGTVYASHDAGRSFRAGRAPLRSPRLSMFAPVDESEPADDDDDDTEDDGAVDDSVLDDGGEDARDEWRAEPSPIDPFALQQGFGYVGDNVWLDIGSSILLKASAGELFAFPYGTTGEAYLEFTPDSPAFWDPQWLNGLRRPDTYYAETTVDAPLSDDADHDDDDGAGDDEEAQGDAGDHALFGIALADGSVMLRGPFGRERSDDGGELWFPVDADDELEEQSAAAPDASLVLSPDALMRASTAPADSVSDDDDEDDDDDDDDGALAGVDGLGASALASFRKLRAARGPSVSEIVEGARARFAPRVDEGGGGAWLPRIDVTGGVVLADQRALLDAVFLDATFANNAEAVRRGREPFAPQTAEVSTNNGEDAAFVRELPLVNPFAFVMLSWDLPALFTPATPPSERRAARDAWLEVERDIVDAVRARDAILVDIARSPARDPVKEIELDAAEARITALSGVKFAKADGAVDDAVARAQAHLGVGDDDAGGIVSGAGWMFAMPSVAAAARYLETNLDESDFLDEITLAQPWVTKSANGRILEARARLTWDLPHTLRASTMQQRRAAQALARVRRDIALDVSAAHFARKRAKLADDDVAVDEMDALLAGWSGMTLQHSGQRRTR